MPNKPREETWAAVCERLGLDIATVALLVCLAPHPTRPAQAKRTAEQPCVVRVSNVLFSCPAGWRIVGETPVDTTIGDFDKAAATAGSITIPAGRATIVIHAKPAIYKDLKAWVYAATKIAPEAVGSQKTLSTKGAGLAEIVSFVSPDSQHDWIYASYFFEVQGTPVNLELNYQRTSSRSSEHRRLLDSVVESADLSQSR